MIIPIANKDMTCKVDFKDTNASFQICLDYRDFSNVYLPALLFRSLNFHQMYLSLVCPQVNSIWRNVLATGFHANLRSPTSRYEIMPHQKLKLVSVTISPSRSQDQDICIPDIISQVKSVFWSFQIKEHTIYFETY